MLVGVGKLGLKACFHATSSSREVLLDLYKILVRSQVLCLVLGIMLQEGGNSPRECVKRLTRTVSEIKDGNTVS